jgi:hypothetical protein
MTENESFVLVFPKTASINSGTGLEHERAGFIGDDLTQYTCFNESVTYLEYLILKGPARQLASAI